MSQSPVVLSLVAVNRTFLVPVVPCVAVCVSAMKAGSVFFFVHLMMADESRGQETIPHP